MSLPAATRAAVLEAPGRVAVRDVPLPDVVETGAALVEILGASLCGSDVEILHGTLPAVTPMVMGHEMVGRVVAVGSGTLDALGRSVAVGDRIVWALATCGRCRACAVLREPDLCERRGYEFLQRADEHPYAIGGLAEHAYIAPAAAKHILDETMPNAWAAASLCTGKTVARAFDRAGGIRPGSTVVVQGAGALGLFATALARHSGAGRVITIGAPEARLELAREFGATDVLGLDTGPEARRESVAQHTEGRGADYVFDFAGAPGVIAEAIGFAGPRGRVVIVGTTDPSPAPVGLSEIMRKELHVIGSVNGDIADTIRSLEVFETLRDRVPWDRLFSPPRPLDEAQDAIEAMARLEVVKSVVDPRL